MKITLILIGLIIGLAVKKLYKETFSGTSLWYYDLHREDFGVKIWNEDR